MNGLSIRRRSIQSARILELGQTSARAFDAQRQAHRLVPTDEEDLKQWHSYYESTAEELAAKGVAMRDGTKAIGEPYSGS